MQKGQLLWEYKPDFSAEQVEQSHEAVEAEAVQAVGDVQNVVLTEKLTNDTEAFGPLKHKNSKMLLDTLRHTQPRTQTHKRAGLAHKT